MTILDILFRNSGQKARTLKPTNQTTPPGFRGILQHQADRCIGCNACTYVCSPGAITLDVQPGEMVWWKYNALRCTYCGRCEDYCPTRAIHLDDHAHAAATSGRAGDGIGRDFAPESGGLAIRHLVKVEFCRRCGQPFNKIPVELLAQMMDRDIPSADRAGYDIATLMSMCPRCRSRVTSQRLKESFTGPAHSKGE
jgi:hydrogenase-4 component H